MVSYTPPFAMHGGGKRVAKRAQCLARSIII